ncbi:MAG: endolytic transglycosylase MltG [bacterium]
MRVARFLRDGLILTVSTALVFVLVEIFCQPSVSPDKYVHVVVDRGMTFSQIAARFEQSGLVRNGLVFKALGRALRLDRRAKAGRYRFQPTASMASLLRALYRGATFRDQIVIPPGRRLDEIARVLARAASVDSTQFVRLARDSAFVASLGVPSKSADGFLFPDTYDIEWREEAPSVLERMVKSFFKVFDDSMLARTREVGLTVNQAVTLASIIEKEAYLETEKPVISAVFHNRLKRGMKLQADPTVRYALGKWKGRVLYSDLKVDSPFNTYMFSGLPPRPICNPGRASIVASLYPREGSRDLFFVAQGDGSHFFSERGIDHELAKARYKARLDSIATEAMMDSTFSARFADSLRARYVADSLKAAGR